MASCKLRAALVTLVLSWGPTLHAQAPVMKMDQVTEEALVNALDVGETAAGGKPRSIHPTPRSKTAAAETAAGRSSLLMTFKTGSADLTPESKKVLATVSRALLSERLAGYSFNIEGHADPRGSADLNERLSRARAKSVVEHLVSAYGVQATRLIAVGKGSAEPLIPDRPDAPENRRVTIVTLRP